VVGQSIQILTSDQSPDFFRIAGLMVADLEPQELVHGIERLRVLSYNAYASAAFGVLERIFDLALQPLHRRHARRNLVMDQHGRIEIPGREHLRDVAQMLADRVAISEVLRIVGRDLDRAAFPASAGSDA